MDDRRRIVLAGTIATLSEEGCEDSFDTRDTSDFPIVGQEKTRQGARAG
jgi:hypothetical protein